MNKKLQLAELLLKKYLKDWVFRYTPDKIKINNKKLDACCFMKNKIIFFNEKYMDRITTKEFKEELLHEITHALLPNEGHSNKFQKKLEELKEGMF